MKIRYPPEPFEGESRASWEGKLRRWRMQEKRRLFVERGSLCERGCGNVATDLDEAVITRGDMRGFSLAQKRIAFASCNLELACMSCNRESAHDRDGAWERACTKYGRENIVAWYQSLALKSPRLDWME